MRVSSPGAPPRPRARTAAVDAFLAVYVATQVAVPLAYYVGDGGYDERFRWRMFSSLGNRTCTHVVEEQLDGGIWRGVDVGAAVGGTHLTSGVATGDPAILRAFVRWRCERGGPLAVRYEVRCALPDGTALPRVAEEIACPAASASDR